MATSAAAVAGAMAARARREVIEYLTGHEAFDPDHAAAMEFPSRLHRRQLDRLVRRGIVHDTGVERYWLDRPALLQDFDQAPANADSSLACILAAALRHAQQLISRPSSFALPMNM